MSGGVADTTMTIWGMGHLPAGLLVGVQILGLDCGLHAVAADGSISVPYGSDAGGLLTPKYIVDTAANETGLTGLEQSATFTVYTGTNNTPTSVTVPVVVGLQYTSRGQLLRPSTRDDLKIEQGDGLGVTRIGHNYSFLVLNAVSFQVGTSFASGRLYTTNLSADGLPADSAAHALPEDQPYTGVCWDALTDGYGFDSMLCWSITRPLPLTICSASIFLTAAER